MLTNTNKCSIISFDKGGIELNEKDTIIKQINDILPNCSVALLNYLVQFIEVAHKKWDLKTE